MSSAQQQSDGTSAVIENHGDAPVSTVNALIGRFGKRLEGVLKYSSFEYESSGDSERYVIGIPQPHSCSYQLSLDQGDCVVEVSLSRDTPFRESELQLLETFLSDLCLQLHELRG